MNNILFLQQLLFIILIYMVKMCYFDSLDYYHKAVLTGSNS